MLAERIFRITDILAKKLQASKLTATEARKLAMSTSTTLNAMRCDSEYEKFYNEAEKVREELGNFILLLSTN